MAGYGAVIGAGSGTDDRRSAVAAAAGAGPGAPSTVKENCASIGFPAVSKKDTRNWLEKPIPWMRGVTPFREMFSIIVTLGIGKPEILPGSNVTV